MDAHKSTIGDIFKSGLVLPEWDEKQIEKRAGFIAKKINEIWPQHYKR